jgi:uncharacterized coiled-coil protein SlyX
MQLAAGDIKKARALTLEAITRAETWTPIYRRQEMLDALTHRLERLERKLGKNQGS